MKTQNKTKVTKAIILARVATTAQSNPSKSLDSQIKRIEEYCKKEGFEIVGNISEVCSGYKNNMLIRLLDFIKGYKYKVVVCCDNLHRLSRNPYDESLKELKKLVLKKKVILHTVSDGQITDATYSNASKNFQSDIHQLLAKHQSNLISDNVRRALERKIQNGEWPNKAPFGYLNAKDKNGKTTIIVDKEKEKVIKFIFKLYSKKITLRDIFSKLREKYPNSTFEMSRGNVYRIIRNKDFYSGHFTHNGNRYPHKYERIIPQELYDICIGVESKDSNVEKSRV